LKEYHPGENNAPAKEKAGTGKRYYHYYSGNCIKFNMMRYEYPDGEA